MPSVIGLLEERERAATQRGEALRGRRTGFWRELREAELDWERFVVSRETRVEVLAGTGDAEVPVPGGPEPSPGRSVVPSWRAGLDVAVLSPEYQRIVQLLSASGTALTCKELASELGVDVMAKTKVEGVRSRARRLVERGWLIRKPSGRFAPAAGVRGGGS
ncbi:hypothetical protein KUF69_24125 [Streptomyces sp. BV129]|nr:hypothetical protein [Streptomyces sp. BV129]MBV1949484.1 hypothetical protein [Streptomyces sp. BV129]